MLLRFLGTSKGSEDVLSVSEARRKNVADAEACEGTTERRCKSVPLERMPSEAGQVDITLGEVARVSDI
jgi:hypothetical protein